MLVTLISRWKRNLKARNLTVESKLHRVIQWSTAAVMMQFLCCGRTWRQTGSLPFLAIFNSVFQRRTLRYKRGTGTAEMKRVVVACWIKGQSVESWKTEHRKTPHLMWWNMNNTRQDELLPPLCFSCLIPAAFPQSYILGIRQEAKAKNNNNNKTELVNIQMNLGKHKCNDGCRRKNSRSCQVTFPVNLFMFLYVF